VRRLRSLSFARYLRVKQRPDRRAKRAEAFRPLN